MNFSMSPTEQTAALNAIARAVWVSVAFSVIVSAVVAWLAMRLRGRVLRRIHRPFLVNALTSITLFVWAFTSSYLFFVTVRPSALLQSVMGVYCFPPNRFQLLLPVLATAATAAAYVVRVRFEESDA